MVVDVSFLGISPHLRDFRFLQKRRSFNGSQFFVFKLESKFTLGT